MNCFLLIRLYVEEQESAAACTEKLSAEGTCCHSLCVKSIDGICGDPVRDSAFSLEGALKLKEISYIHAEAYAAGELKHGTIALITDHVPVIAIATQKHIFAKTISNIREVKARGAYVVLLVTEDTAVDEGIADVIIRIPKEDDKFTVFPIAVVLQLIAYYASVQKGLDVDQPRNLAKSVTVE